MVRGVLLWEEHITMVRGVLLWGGAHHHGEGHINHGEECCHGSMSIYVYLCIGWKL